MRLWLFSVLFCWAISSHAQPTQKDSLARVYTQPIHGNAPALSSINTLKQKLLLAEETHDKSSIAQCVFELGVAYEHQAQYPAALEAFIKAKRLFEELQNSKRVAACLNSIGLVYHNQRNHTKALAYFEESLALKQRLGDNPSIAATLNNMAIVYRVQGNYTRALNFYKKVLQIRLEAHDQRAVSAVLNNIGQLYEAQGEYDTARRYYEESIAMKEKTEDKAGLVYSLNGLADIARKQGETAKAIAFAERALVLARETHTIREIHKTAHILHLAYKTQGEFEKALAYHEFYKQLTDSIFSLDKVHLIADLEQRLLVDKHQRELETAQEQTEIERLRGIAQKEIHAHHLDLMNSKMAQSKIDAKRAKAENRAKALEIQQHQEARNFQRTIIYLVLVGLAGAIVGLVIIFRSRRKERITNAQLQTTLHLVSQNKKEIERKNEAITDSINYARRIQAAILPPLELFEALLPESFVFFRPRDIVSGDIYYLEAIAGKIIVSAIDCTGHGVPGALMSMMGKEIIDQIVHHSAEIHADTLLNELHKGIRKTLKQAQNENRDGMDLALVVIDKAAGKMEFAGAKNPIVYFQNGELYHIKGDRKCIGGEQREAERLFTRHEINLPTESNTTFYLFSDGFQDQFGGADNRKIGIERLKTWLTEIQQDDMKTQANVLETRLNEWIKAKNTRQMDDILVLGVRI